MSENLHCGPAVHAAISSDPAAFARQRWLGYQVAEGDTGPVDVQELRRCAACGTTMARALGIEARLASARSIGDVSMIGRCERALHPDPFTDRIDDSAIRSFLDAVEIERLTGGAL